MCLPIRLHSYDNYPSYQIGCELVNIVNIVDICSGDLNSSSDHESVMYMHIFAYNLIIRALKYFQHHLKQTSSSVCEVGLGLCSLANCHKHYTKLPTHSYVAL